MAEKKKTASDMARELGIPVDHSKDGKVVVKVPARALKGSKPKPR